MSHTCSYSQGPALEPDILFAQKSEQADFCLYVIDKSASSYKDGTIAKRILTC